MNTIYHRIAIIILKALEPIVLLIVIAITLQACGFDLSLSSSGNGYCVEPAPIKGQFDPSTPGYIVVFHEGVVAAKEINRLIAIYDIRVGAIYQDATVGFFAEMSNITLEQLRCEMSIQFVEYNGSVTSVTR